jgi:hypothetical protein
LDPVIIARMDRVQDAVRRGRPVAAIAEAENVSIDTVYDDLAFLERLHQERLTGAAQERFDFVAGVYLENIAMMRRTFYSTSEPHAQIMAVDRRTKANTELRKLYRLDQPTVGEEQASKRPETNVTVNDNRQVNIGLPEIEAIIRRQEEEDRLAIPATTIEHFRGELGPENVKLPGERLDVDGEEDEEDW